MLTCNGTQLFLVYAVANFRLLVNWKRLSCTLCFRQAKRRWFTFTHTREDGTSKRRTRRLPGIAMPSVTISSDIIAWLHSHLTKEMKSGCCDVERASRSSDKHSSRSTTRSWVRAPPFTGYVPVSWLVPSAAHPLPTLIFICKPEIIQLCLVVVNLCLYDPAR